MNFSKEEVEAAKKADIVEYAKAKGIALDRTGADEYKGVDHDSLVITPSKNAFYWNSRGLHGTGALNFAKDYEQADSTEKPNKKFLKAVEDVINSGVSEAKLTAREAETKPFQAKDIHFAKDNEWKQTWAYLTKTRGLNSNLVDNLHKQGLIMQDSGQDGDHRKHAIFVWKDPTTGQIKGASRQGLSSIKGTRSYKRIVRNSTKGYAFSFDSEDVVEGKGKPENLRFFESSIDAISYYSLSLLKDGHGLKNTRFVAMDGLKKEVFDSYVTKTAEELQKTNDKLHSVALGVDNDEAGQRFYEDIHGIFAQVQYAKPNEKYGKDWNDVIKHYKKIVLNFQNNLLQKKPKLAKRAAIREHELER